MTPVIFRLPLAAVFFASTVFCAPSDSLVREPRGPDRPGQAAFVKTPDAPLIFTGQLLGWNDDRAFSPDAATQTRNTLRHLQQLLRAAGSSLDRVVKLNVYVTEDELHGTVSAALGAAFEAHPIPMSFVRTALFEKNARVAIDAVAQLSPSAKSAPSNSIEGLPLLAAGSHFGVLPAGRRVFLSGDASRLKGFREGLREVFDRQRATLRHHGLTPANAVQVKAWLNPLSRLDDLRAELSAFFGDSPIPPVVLIEWTRVDGNEIEFILDGKNALADRFNGPLAFGTRPGVPAPTRFSHVAFVEAGQPLIFITGLYGSPQGDVRNQLQDIFAELGRILFRAGSGFRYLAKATYHNTDLPGRTALGEIRDVYFDPARPPSASGVVVHGVGYPGATATLDMIAVPLPKN